MSQPQQILVQGLQITPQGPPSLKLTGDCPSSSKTSDTLSFQKSTTVCKRSRMTPPKLNMSMLHLLSVTPPHMVRWQFGRCIQKHSLRSCCTSSLETPPHVVRRQFGRCVPKHSLRSCCTSL